MSQTYELALILKVGVGSETVEKAVAGVKKQIDSMEGKVKSEQDLGKRILAFAIKKEKEGHYFVLTISLPAKQVKALSEKLKASDNIVRYLVLRKE
jgi:small subunit ribosomal protein S6